MPYPPAPLPAALGDTFTCSAARAAAVSPARLRAKDLESPYRGMRTKAVADEDEDDDLPLAQDERIRNELLVRSRAYATVMEPHAFFAGRTAAVIHRGPVALGPELDVAVWAPARAPRRRGIHGSQVQRGLVHVSDDDGLRVTTPASTWAMLASELSTRELVVLGDAFVRIPRDRSGRPHPHRRLTTIEELERAAGAGPRTGVAKLREAGPLIRVGSASPLETEYRLDAAAAGLPPPDLDVEIYDEGGRLVGITEIAYREFGVLVEVEGDHHRTRRAQWDRDIEKYAAYTALGWEVVRLTSRHIRGKDGGPPTAAARVRAVLRRHGWQP